MSPIGLIRPISGYAMSLKLTISALAVHRYHAAEPYMKMFCSKLLLSFSSVLLATAVVAAESAPRERLLLDFGWKFHLGNEWGIGQNLDKAGTGNGPANASLSDASWRTVNLPHDWAIELPFDQNADGSHGFKALGRG